MLWEPPPHSSPGLIDGSNQTTSITTRGLMAKSLIRRLARAPVLCRAGDSGRWRGRGRARLGDVLSHGAGARGGRGLQPELIWESSTCGPPSGPY